MPAGKSIIEIAWEQLDAQVLEIVELATKPGFHGPALEVAKARARGKAEILALLTIPHFTTADEVSAESSRRHQAHLAGDTTYRTAGLT